MPVKLVSDESEEQAARIEIIPLIDIMFFLLAAFMLVSLSMSHFRGLKVELHMAAIGTATAPSRLPSRSRRATVPLPLPWPTSTVTPSPTW